jgi:ribonuclease P protein subunit POP4
VNDNILKKDELIGVHIKIKKCKDPIWEGKSGIIIDETKNTLIIRIDNKDKKIAKKIATFEFDLKNKKITINGFKMIYRPEDRIKKAR